MEPRPIRGGDQTGRTGRVRGEDAHPVPLLPVQLTQRLGAQHCIDLAEAGSSMRIVASGREGVNVITVQRVNLRRW